ncbi:hypothetical protein BC629DRAFT_1590342 [Irpex lacteus]|nr:hypothetical protein BC629DRAFT_1590342 [Irpex lacteus]
MPGGGKLARTLSQAKDDYEELQRRIRHITSLQVRNLTPFPARDEFASALSQPSEQPQFTAHGHLSDDLDLSVSKRRGRRRSSTSVSTITWQEPPTNGSQETSDVAGRKRAMSRASIATTSSIGRTTGHGGAAPARPPLRQRTLSTASTISQGTMRSHELPAQPTISLSRFLQDTSQETLEHILQSRLVETFLTLRAVQTESRSPEVILQPPPPGHRAGAVNGHEEPKTHRRSSTSGSGSLPRSSLSGRNTASHSLGPKAGSSGHSKSLSLSASKTSLTPSATKPLSQRSVPRGSTTPKAPSTPFSAPSSSKSHIQRPIPDYISLSLSLH